MKGEMRKIIHDKREQDHKKGQKAKGPKEKGKAGTVEVEGGTEAQQDFEKCLHCFQYEFCQWHSSSYPYTGIRMGEPAT